MRVYRTTGLRLVLLGAAIAAVRTAMAGSWLPRSGKGVVLFTLAELCLIPLGLLLLVCSVLLGIEEARRAGREEPPPGTAPGSRAIAAVLTGLSLLLVVAFAVALFPVLSRGLGWGRYGVPIQEPLRALRDVTTLAGIPVPREATLVKGTIRWRDPNRYVYAVMTMPSAEAHRFLEGQDGWKWEVDPGLADDSFLPPEMKRDLTGRAGVIYANGGGPPRSRYEAPATIIAAVSLGRDGRALVCLYWLPVW